MGWALRKYFGPLGALPLATKSGVFSDGFCAAQPS